MAKHTLSCQVLHAVFLNFGSLCEAAEVDAGKVVVVMREIDNLLDFVELKYYFL